MSINKPLFSIVVPTYNRPDMLKSALTSVGRQTFNDYEVIVVDDCSSLKYDIFSFDDGINVLYHRNKRNLGQAGSRNVGVSLAKGEYIVFLDDDDELDGCFLEANYNYYNDKKWQVDFSWSSVEFVKYEDGLRSHRLLDWGPILGSEKFLVERCMRIGLGYGVVIKKAFFEKMNGLNTDYRVFEDTEFFARMLSLGYRPHEVRDAKIYVHDHNDQRLTQDASLLNLKMEECKKILDLYSDFFNEYFHCKSSLHWTMEKIYLSIDTVDA
ncbi:glycosyltransferase family 2 protein [Teredinibacter sp. KSP-S5-2]|uniref:glycosyltransferase family 2 protein n=1 Tax=Teredinibacter sp. KSP-S5-2 TaxID=3034506 RepID=UPI002934588E|nr:glycosyltransferase family 2 protein [Teredinibacter sp. KSP-S5-2]WNO11592.1 glycosyltransferase family 2 protein [Teredinibacter sp. KSP-S5-2]